MEILTVYLVGAYHTESATRLSRKLGFDRALNSCTEDVPPALRHPVCVFPSPGKRLVFHELRKDKYKIYSIEKEIRISQYRSMMESRTLDAALCTDFKTEQLF